MNINSILKQQLRKGLRSPRELLRFLGPNARRLLGLKLKGVSDEFAPDAAATPDSNLTRRKYKNYEAYLDHQRSKLDILLSGDPLAGDGTNIDRYDKEFRAILRERLVRLGFEFGGRTVLCLAARLGTEVKSFLDCGAFAVGVDLNPGPGNCYVLSGDFHNLVFASGSIDFLYSNSVDHAFELQKLAKEACRILKSGGHFILDLQLGRNEGERQNTGLWESYEWTDTKGVVGIFCQNGFSKSSETRFEKPWPGACCILKKSEDGKA